MFRVLSALVVLCLLAQAVVTGRAAVACPGCDPVSAASANEGHHDHAALQNGCCSGSEGAPCPPDCDECVCCPHQRPMTLQASVATPILARFDVDYVRAADPTARAHADEILHIPKLLPCV